MTQIDKWKYRDLTEWEYIMVFEASHDEVIELHTEEVEEGQWIPVEDFAREIEGDETNFTPDTVLRQELKQRFGVAF